MKKIIIVAAAVCFVVRLVAQETVYPAPPNKGVTYIKNANIHTGTGKTITNGVIKISNGKIEQVGTASEVSIPADASVVDAKGKEVYPGLILSSSNLGLIEVSAVRASTDSREIGELNPNVRSIVAYNTDSKVINTLRSNGILMANIIPEGSLLAGSSSVVQLDAWTWDDAAYKTDEGIHLYMPSLLPRPAGAGRGGGGGGGGRNNPAAADRDPVKEGLEKIEGIKSFFREAKAYLAAPAHDETNLKFESVKGLFGKTQKLYLHANTVKQLLVALDFVKEFNFDVVIVGGSDSWQVADLLKQHNISVILQQPHSLPTLDDDDVDQPYKTAALLQKAGVLFTITDDDGQTRGRNLAFNAGTAVAYGLTKEEALAAITLNAAKILGVSDKAGSIEVGKDANIIISDGDILDMRTSNVTDAFIQGRKIDLNDKQKLLNERYKEKYKLKGF
ncbi:MAG: amidohydrolase family protein [Chitinophagaceae bacterium]